MITTRFRRLAAIVAVALGAGLTTAIQPASAATVVYVVNASVTRVYHGATYAVVGYAAPGATVVLHYHRAGTATSDYSIERSVRADSDGFWYREARLDVDYRVFATVGTGNPHSPTLLFTAAGATPPRITSPASTELPFGQLYTVKGTSAPLTQVVVHYRRDSAPTVDIARVAYTNDQGVWSREAVLDTSYSVFATVGTGNPHSGTVRFTGHRATVGDVLDIDFAPTSGSSHDVRNTLGTQLRGFVNDLPGSSPTAGMRVVEASLCVRNRGPETFNDSPARTMVVLEDDGSYTFPDLTIAGSQGTLDLSYMGVSELRCGVVDFEVATTASITSFAYSPGLVENYYAGYWDVSGPATTPAKGAAHHAAPAAPAKPAVRAPSDAQQSTPALARR